MTDSKASVNGPDEQTETSETAPESAVSQTAYDDDDTTIPKARTQTLRLPVDTIATKKVSVNGRVNLGRGYIGKRVIYGVIDAHRDDEELPMLSDVEAVKLKGYIDEIMSRNEEMDALRRHIKRLREHMSDVGDEEGERMAGRAHAVIQRAMLRASGTDVPDSELDLDTEPDPVATAIRHARSDEGPVIEIDRVRTSVAESKGRVTVGSEFSSMRITIAILDVRDKDARAPYAPLGDEEFGIMLNRAQRLLESAEERDDAIDERRAAEIAATLRRSVSGVPEEANEEDIAALTPS